MLAEVAEDLVRGALAEHPGEAKITLLAISVSHLEQQSVIQLDLPHGLAGESAARARARRGALDGRPGDGQVRDRFGWEAVG